MREGWEYQKLGDLGRLTSSKRIFKSEYVKEGVPFYRSKEIKELGNGSEVSLELYITSERYKEIKERFGVPKKGDILLTAVGTIGEMYVVDESHDFYFKDGNIMWLKNFDSLDPYFLKYTLTLFVEQLKAMSQGSAYSALTIEKLKKYSIPSPPLAEQKQIVAILDQAFAAIDQAKVNISTNIQNAKELFQSKLNDIFSQRGDGWEEEKWSDVLEIRSGRNQKEVENPNGLYPILGSAGKVMGFANRFICEKGTTIIGRKGTINNPMFIDSEFWNVDTAFGLHALEGLHKKFLYFFCLSYDFTARDKGSGRPSLVKKDLLTMVMPIPTLNVQNQTVEECENLKQGLFDIETNYLKKLDSLEELKKSILQKAFAGELTANSSALAKLKELV
jgi:type I restriction enzyme S subunit